MMSIMSAYLHFIQDLAETYQVFLQTHLFAIYTTQSRGEYWQPNSVKKKNNVV